MNMFPNREAVHALSAYWWTFLLRGIIAILFGITAWLWPGLTLKSLIWLAGIWLVVDGVFSIIGAIMNRDEYQRIWPVLLWGVAGILFGIFIMAYPDITAIWVIVSIGFYAILSGVFAVVSAISLRKVIDNEWSMGLLGLVSIIFGLMMILFPGSGAISLIWVIAVYAILIGIAEIAFAFKVKNLHDTI